MGNVSSTKSEEPKTKASNNKRDLPAEVVDIMATRFITSEQSAENHKLSDADYCNNLVGQLSNIIYDSATPAQIVYLSQLRNPSESESASGSLSVEDNCQEIAKFYTQIAQVYRAIYGAIKPRVIDKEGKSVTIMTNPCSERIRALLGNSDSADDIREINPAYCSVNKDTNNLSGIPGLAALDYLYYDKYNPVTHSYDSMTDKTAELYEETVEKLHRVYTDAPLKSSPVTSFANIELRNFAADPGCAEAVLVGNEEQSIEDWNKEFQNITKNIESDVRPQTRRHANIPGGNRYASWPWGNQYGYGNYYQPPPRAPLTAPTLDDNSLPNSKDVIEYINDNLRNNGLHTESDGALKTLLEQRPDPSAEIDTWPDNLKTYITEYRATRHRMLKDELTTHQKRWLAGNPDEKQRKHEVGGRGVYRETYSMKNNEQLHKYVAGIKVMENNLFKAQQKLLRVLDMLFVYIQLPESGTKVITINPSLTHSRLEKDIIPMVRKVIRDLYSSCEQDFTELIKIYEAAVAKQQALILTKQIKFLESREEY
jgi:hypothetical protein